MAIEQAPSLPPNIARALPFARKMLRLESGQDRGRVIHMVDHGARDGRVVLMQHGNPTWCYLWRKVIDLLDPHTFRCIAPDMLGLGLSSTLPRVGDHSLDRHVDALSEVITELNLNNVILMGQDWGGPIIASLGARYPGRISGLVLGNTSVLAPRNPRGTAFHRFSRMPGISDLAFRVLGYPARALHKVQGDPSSIQGEVAQAYRWPLASFARRVAPLALARMVPDSLDHPSMPGLRDGEDWARNFTGPASLVWGTKDPILGRALKRHEELLPKATVTVTPAGHFLQEEVPEHMANAVISVHRRILRAEAQDKP